MGIVKVLKRKDGASLVVGVSLAVLVTELVSSIAKSMNSNISYGQQAIPVGASWTIQYLQPIVIFMLELIVLEILVWAYVFLHSTLKDSKK